MVCKHIKLLVLAQVTRRESRSLGVGYLVPPGRKFLARKPCSVVHVGKGMEHGQCICIVLNYQDLVSRAFLLSNPEDWSHNQDLVMKHCPIKASGRISLYLAKARISGQKPSR